MISYLEINDSYLIVKKEAHLPTAPLRPDDESLLSIVIKDFPDVACVEGKKNVEKGLIHRIDTETTGLVLVARNQQTYDFFQNEQKNNRIKKYYTAFCDVKNIPVNTQNGFPPFLKKIQPGDEIASFFIFYGKERKEVRPVIESDRPAALKKSTGKRYSTFVESIERVQYDTFPMNKIIYSLTQGFRHQVRVHSAWAGYPILGDTLYNKHSADDKKMAFFAHGLQFMDPVTNKIVFFQFNPEEFF